MKHLVYILFFVTCVFAQYQQVKIGTIDKKYTQTLTHEQLKTIIKEIEEQFESQLGFNVFDYSEDGKPIDIVYIKETQKKKTLNRYKNNLTSIQKKLKLLNKDMDSVQIKIESERKKLKQELNALNELIRDLNIYVKETSNSSKKLTSREYERLKEYISKEEVLIKKKEKLYKKNQSDYNKQIKLAKRKNSKYNVLVKRHNSLVRRIEVLSKSIVEVKGKAIGKNIATTKTYYKYGEKHIEKAEYTEMEKIEIYSFDGDLHQLKAVVAHEIAHLVGVGHIEESGALMNPLLQENQIKYLELKYSDIMGFEKAWAID